MTVLIRITVALTALFLTYYLSYHVALPCVTSTVELVRSTMSIAH